jgi:molecular chaperone DnaK
LVYNIEKMLKESGDKVGGAEKAEVEAALASAKSTLSSNPSVAELKAAHEKLTAASHKLAEAMYKATPAGDGPLPTDGTAAGAGTADAPKHEEGVIDAEYVDVEPKR